MAHGVGPVGELAGQTLLGGPVVQDLDILRALADTYGLDRIPSGLKLSEVSGLLSGVVTAQFCAGVAEVTGDVNDTGDVVYNPFTQSITASGGQAASISLVHNALQASKQNLITRACVRVDRTVSATNTMSNLQVAQLLPGGQEVEIWGQEIKAWNFGWYAGAFTYFNLPTPILLPAGHSLEFRQHWQHNRMSVRISFIGWQGSRVPDAAGIGSMTTKSMVNTVS